jgi:hypothetical protein
MYGCKLIHKRIMSRNKRNQSRLDFLYQLRREEMEALEELDVARSTNDPVMQNKALDKLRRTMIDFAFDTYLVWQDSKFGQQHYSIDYSYFKEWRDNQKIKSIQSEIKYEEDKPPMVIRGVLTR